MSVDCPDHALLTTDAMGAADRATIASGRFSGPALMDNAGAAVADVVLARFADAPVVHVLCGPGNNGGDGYVAARILTARGIVVHLHALAAPKPGTDAEQAAERWQGAVRQLDTFDPSAGDLVIDALFGAGFSGALPAPAKTALHRAAGSGCPVLAVDLPSGVNGDTGQGPDAVVCAATVTFYRKKPGHLLLPGRMLCGETIVADIGVRADKPCRLFENVPALWCHALPSPVIDTHKYACGAVAVFSGPRHGSGASRLAAMAAQRAGAGAVTILGHPNALDVHAAHVTSIILRATGDDPFAALMVLKGIGAIVLGPGLGNLDLALELAPAILERTDATLVLDADGITAFAAQPDVLFDAAARRLERTGQPGLVLTPHAGEFARLFPEQAANSEIGKLEQAQSAAKLANAVMIFKGPDTVIAVPDGRAAINTNATPALATAGSGDVMAGIVAGLAAQAMPIFEAACASVWLHGEVGRRAGPRATAEDLVATLPDAFAAID